MRRSVSCLPLFVTMVAAFSCGNAQESPSCTANDHTICKKGVVYWVDSCGKEGDVAEACDCGCASDFKSCKQDCATCTPSCGDRVCGDDGCSGSCGSCEGGTACNASGQCVACTPSCGTRVCGDDGCDGSCGSCDQGKTCNAAGQCEGGSTGSNVMTVNCKVPYVLDASRITDQAYMLSHFSDLVQQYCITGMVDSIDVSASPEKMFYGQHDSGNTLSLVQTSMSAALMPEYSVKIDFSPDTEVQDGKVWTVSVAGLNPPEAVAGLLRYQGTTSVCIYGIGMSGQLTFSGVKSVTQVEGGSFTLTGSFEVGNPWDLSDFCSQAPAELPCCPH